MKNLVICFVALTSIGTILTETTYNCLTNSTCGCSTSSTILTKIVGGEAAASQTWGWAASLRYSSTNSHFCGGSIITRSHILTAAHCTVGLQSTSSVRVTVGSIYLSTIVQARDVSKIFIHPTYSSKTYVDDISILKLSSPLNLDQAGVDTVCLPDVSESFLSTNEYPSADVNLIAIGWGYLYENSGSVSNTLRQVTVQSIAFNSTYCENAGITDASKQMCAGVMPFGGKDTCQGDSGGSLLMFTSDNVWQQVGITSNGYGCARAGYPGVYTRVAAYESWINETINDAQQRTFSSHVILINFSFIYVFCSLPVSYMN